MTLRRPSIIINPFLDPPTLTKPPRRPRIHIRGLLNTHPYLVSVEYYAQIQPASPYGQPIASQPPFNHYSAMSAASSNCLQSSQSKNALNYWCEGGFYGCCVAKLN